MKKLMKFALYGVVGLAVLGTGAFVVLGQMSQSGAALGLVDGRLAACPSAPNCASSEADTSEEKRVDPLSADAWEAIPTVIAEMGGVVTAQDDTYLAAEFTSATFGFVDDVEFRLADDSVQVRSGSRVGYSDRGVNRARVDEIRNRLSTQ